MPPLRRFPRMELYAQVHRTGNRMVTVRGRLHLAFVQARYLLYGNEILQRVLCLCCALDRDPRSGRNGVF